MADDDRFVLVRVEGPRPEDCTDEWIRDRLQDGWLDLKFQAVDVTGIIHPWSRGGRGFIEGSFVMPPALP